jgi:hypothetical protein
MSTRTLGSTFGPRKGCAEIVHTYTFAWNTAGITDSVNVDIISASTDNPVELEFSVQVVTAFNGTGDAAVIEIGLSADTADFLELSSDESLTPGYYPASNAVAKFRVTAQTEIWITLGNIQLDTDAGDAVLIVKEIVQNIEPVV